jgi:hypothetical protein
VQGGDSGKGKFILDSILARKNRPWLLIAVGLLLYFLHEPLRFWSGSGIDFRNWGGIIAVLGIIMLVLRGR